MNKDDFGSWVVMISHHVESSGGLLHFLHSRVEYIKYEGTATGGRFMCDAGFPP